MFSFIRREGRAVTREEAAQRMGISRKLAAFHLDKLVEAGLLHARYESPGMARKVGRRPKVYEATGAQISLSIPDRRHQLLADILLDAVLDEGDDECARDAAMRTAQERGLAVGASMRDTSHPGQLRGDDALATCEQMLEVQGYEPVREGSQEVRLRNCPFHPLAAKAPDLVCAMNHAFLAGCVEGLQATGINAVLAPTPGECCVRLTAP